MVYARKNHLNRLNMETSNSFAQTDHLIFCEVCGTQEVPKKAHFRCYSCGKYTCFECAHYHAVFLKEPLTLRVQSMRLCPNCKLKNRRSL